MRVVSEKSTVQTISNHVVLWLMEHSLFFVALREKIAYTVHKHAEYAWHQLKKEKSDNIIMLDHPSFKNYENSLKELITYLQKHHKKSILIRFPYRIYHNKSSSHESTVTSYYWKPAIEKMFDIINTVSMETNTPIIDCETPFENMDKTYLFSDVMHLTPAANKIFAEIIYNYLIRQDWFRI